MTPKSGSTSIISENRLPLWVIGAIILLGTALRIWRLSDLGLVHFDEGVYAISGLWSLTPWKDLQLYPKQILFSPPLFICLVGAGYWLSSAASDTAAILVSVVMGAATIALVWWVARRWFGQGAGLAAATLVALSDYHIAFSRMALTDVTFGFFFLLSLALITVTLETGSFRWAALSGLAVGAAWNTKYHGWVPLLMALLALLVFAVMGGQERSRSKRLLLCWLIMTAVAAACYFPWAAYVQTKPGGYFAFMKYQRRFLSPHWLQNFWRQAEIQWFMDGWLSRSSPIVAYLLALVVRDKQQRLNWSATCLAGLVLLCSGFVLGGMGTAAATAILAIPMLVRSGRWSSWLLLCSLGFLLLLTPLYRPYARLLLPFVLTVYIAAGAGIRGICVNAAANRSSQESKLNKRAISALSAVACLLAIVGLFVGIRPTPRTWMATDSVRKAVATMADLLPSDSTVFVHGAPEIAFYFLHAGRRAIPIDYPIDHPDVVTRFHPGAGKDFLVTGVYSQREPQSRASLRRTASRLHLVGVFPIQPNDVRLLDDFTPRDARQYRLHPTNEYALHLYGIDPASDEDAKP